MAQISNVRNDGNGAVTTGPKQVNSYNVAPYTVVATPSGNANQSVPASKGGSVITKTELANFEFFNVNQTSAATDLIVVAPNLPQGTEFQLYATAACKVIISGTDTINGGTAGQGVTMAATNIYMLNKTSTSAWIVQQQVPAGTTTFPTPA